MADRIDRWNAAAVLTQAIEEAQACGDPGQLSALLACMIECRMAEAFEVLRKTKAAPGFDRGGRYDAH